MLKTRKLLKYSDFILNSYDCLWLFPSHYLPMQHIYITDYQWLFILIGTTSVLTNTQNVGTNANRCISLFCIYVLYRLFSALLWMSAIRYKVLNDRAFPQVCYRTLVECKGSGFLGISVVCTEILHENIWLAWINVVIHDLFVWKSVFIWALFAGKSAANLNYSLGKV